MDAEKIITTDGGNSFTSGALMGAGLNKGTDAAALMASQFGNNWLDDDDNPYGLQKAWGYFNSK